MYRRFAAALVREGYVLAAREHTDGYADFDVPAGKEHLTYEVLDRLTLPSGEIWAIAAPCPNEWPQARELTFVGDYAAWFEVDGNKRSLDAEDLPASIFKSSNMTGKPFGRRKHQTAVPLSADAIPAHLAPQVAALSAAAQSGNIVASSKEELLAKLQALAPDVTLVLSIDEDDEGTVTVPLNSPPYDLN